MPKENLPPVALALRRFRKELQCNQQSLADLLGVSLSTIAKWETGIVTPSPMACMVLSQKDKKHREWWVSQAGDSFERTEEGVAAYKQRHSYAHEDMMVVPIVTAVVAAGYPDAVEPIPDEYEGSIAIPIPKGGVISSMVAARCKGRSMLPRIPEDSILIINTAARLPQDNVGYMVVARSDEGALTVKTLCESDGHYFLLADNPDFHPQIQSIDANNPWTIAGRLHAWLGVAADPRRR